MEVSWVGNAAFCFGRLRFEVLMEPPDVLSCKELEAEVRSSVRQGARNEIWKSSI